MNRITSNEVRKYMLWRADEELVHCPKAISFACNEACDPIPSLHTHSYNFHTATGRHIIDTIRQRYYEYED